MGSWLQTCAITNLPIQYQEEVYVFLLLESPNFEKYVSSHCYVSAYYNCLPFYFSGQYDDYGKVANCSSELLNTIILPAIKNSLVEMPVGENTVHDIAISKEKFDLQFLFEADHKNRLFLHAWRHFGKRGGDSARLTHILIKKNVLDSILANYTFTSYSEILPDKDYNYRYTFSDILGEAQQFVKILKKLNSNELLNISSRFRIKPNSYFGETVFRAFGDDRWQHIMQIWPIIEEHLHSPILPEIVHQVCVYQFLNNFMLEARRVWIKPSGMGSQDTELAAINLLSNISLEEIDKINKSFDE